MASCKGPLTTESVFLFPIYNTLCETLIKVIVSSRANSLRHH
jgi:hypothetical protein